MFSKGGKKFNRSFKEICKKIIKYYVLDVVWCIQHGIELNQIWLRNCFQKEERIQEKFDMKY